MSWNSDNMDEIGMYWNFFQIFNIGSMACPKIKSWNFVRVCLGKMHFDGDHTGYRTKYRIICRYNFALNVTLVK